MTQDRLLNGLKHEDETSERAGHRILLLCTAGEFWSGDLNPESFVSCHKLWKAGS